MHCGQGLMKTDYLVFFVCLRYSSQSLQAWCPLQSMRRPESWKFLPVKLTEKIHF